jgi:hypothetical protein
MELRLPASEWGLLPFPQSRVISPRPAPPVGADAQDARPPVTPFGTSERMVGFPRRRAPSAQGPVGNSTALRPSPAASVVQIWAIMPQLAPSMA